MPIHVELASELPLVCGALAYLRSGMTILGPSHFAANMCADGRVSLAFQFAQMTAGGWAQGREPVQGSLWAGIGSGCC